MSNTVTVTGNLTRDPELRYTPSGAAVVNFGVADNRRWKNKHTDQWDEATSFFNVTCWQDLAHNVATSLEKGARVMIVGRLEQRSYETQDGEKRSVVEITADEVGPSLRWATATVAKVERNTPADNEPQPHTAPEPAGVGAGPQDPPF